MRQSSIISYDLNLVILEREWISYCRQQSSGAPYTSLTPPPHCTTSGPSPGCGLEARSRDGLGEGRRGFGGDQLSECDQPPWRRRHPIRWSGEFVCWRLPMIVGGRIISPPFAVSCDS